MMWGRDNPTYKTMQLGGKVHLPLVVWIYWIVSSRWCLLARCWSQSVL